MMFIVSIALSLHILCVPFEVHLHPSPHSATRAVAAVSGHVGPRTVWRPGRQVIAKIRTKCSADPATVRECFLREMQRAGASPEAVAFSEAMSENGYGYLRAFRHTGRVSVAYVQYVFRANEMEGVFLVNGQPKAIDVDDYKYLSSEQWRKNAHYVSLLKRYPQLSVWPGQRNDLSLPRAITSEKGQKFDLDYTLRNGCHACAQVGTGVVSFFFDGLGRFREARVTRVSSELPR